MPTRLLILGGTTEANQLAAALADDPEVTVTTSLAGRTRAPALPPGAVRIGGFGGIDGLAHYLREQKIDRVIDATHPFAATITRNAATACAQAQIPRAVLTRPAWIREPGDDWREVADMAAAAEALNGWAKRVFLTVGRQDLAPFAQCCGIRFLIRSIDPPQPMPAIRDWELVLARGPFTQEAEVALMRDWTADCLVTKNSGGAATYAKIAAARDLRLPVIMVRRPTLPESLTLLSVEAALVWVRGHGCSSG
jgi:precorrin-6A/cobalt-precorrin-6A reductase